MEIRFSLEDLKKTVGSRLREVRIEKGFSQLQLAELMDISGSTVAKYETAKILPSLEALVQFAIFFDVSADYLLGLHNNH